MNNSKKSILFVHNMHEEGVAPTGIFVYEQAHNLSAYVEEIEVALYSLRMSRFSFYNYVNFWALLSTIKKNSTSIIHAHYGLTLIAVFLASIFHRGKLKVVVTFHGSDLYSGGIVAFISNLLCLLLNATPVVVSNRMLEFLWPVNRSRAKVVPCAINLSNSEGGIDFRFITALFPGDPSRDVKNFEGYLHLVRQLHREGVYLKTIFLTSINKMMVGRILDEVDVVVLVSKWEGSPQIVKEAISQLVPVYSLDVGDVKSVIGDINGCFVAKSISELADKIVKTNCFPRLDSGECRITMRSFGPDIISAKLKDIYDSI